MENGRIVEIGNHKELIEKKVYIIIFTQ